MTHNRYNKSARNAYDEWAIRHLSDQDFINLGTDAVAYMRQIKDEGDGTWAIFAADGEHIVSCESRDLAISIILQNEMNPLSVH